MNKIDGTLEWDLLNSLPEKKNCVWDNDWKEEKHQDIICTCPKGSFVSKIASQHKNDREDRWFSIECRRVLDALKKNHINKPKQISNWKNWKTDWTKSKDEWFFRPDDKADLSYFMTGFRSKYDTIDKDRKFQFFFGTADNVYVHEWERFYLQPSKYDEFFQVIVNRNRMFKMPYGMWNKGIVGVWSEYNEEDHDRRFVFIEKKFTSS